MIYVVDDDPDAADILSQALETLERTSRTFFSAEECMAAIMEVPPACVVSDLNMPVTDGLAFIAMLAAKGIKVPVIIVTAASHLSFDVNRARGVCNALLFKPFLLEDLERALNTALQVEEVDPSKDFPVIPGGGDLGEAGEPTV